MELVCPTLHSCRHNDFTDCISHEHSDTDRAACFSELAVSRATDSADMEECGAKTF